MNKQQYQVLSHLQLTEIWGKHTQRKQSKHENMKYQCDKEPLPQNEKEKSILNISERNSLHPFLFSIKDVNTI